MRAYDYTRAGSYFVTACTSQRLRLFGKVRDGAMVLSAAGRIVETAWLDLPAHYPHVRLDAFVVMPDHVHGIVVLRDSTRDGDDDVDVPNAPEPVGAGFKPAPTVDLVHATTAEWATAVTVVPGDHALSEIVRGFKTFSSRRINRLHGTPGRPVWQRNYYEHIIRNQRSLERIRNYIIANPARWKDG